MKELTNKRTKNERMKQMDRKKRKNKVGNTANLAACGWAGAIFEVTRPFGQEQQSQRIKIIKKVKCD